MQLLGLHHVSAITASAKENVHFYTKIMGMRLVKKTVNQDEPSMYHLFYGDEVGNPGTELTFFEIPPAGRTHEGTNSITTTSLRVPNDEALMFWQKRFSKYDVGHEEIKERFGRQTLRFRDFENQRLMLVSDENNVGVAGGSPFERDDIPVEYGITGLGPMYLTVRKPKATIAFLTDLFGLHYVGSYPSDDEAHEDIIVYAMGEGGTGAEVHIVTRDDLPRERPGRGSVHHIAFRVANEEEMHAWIDRLDAQGKRHSGFVDRFYFKSVYIPNPNGILIELATDGPGFATDEEIEHLGETLALPPFLEAHREDIEADLKPIKPE